MNGRLYDFFGRVPERKGLAQRRARLVGDLEGDVLELGAGTGFTLPHYRKARRIVAVEPDGSMARRLREKAGATAVPVEVVDASAEELPFADASFDHVVCALVLCSVRDPERVLAEVRRVLKPSGSLVFLEHVRGTGRLARWQDRLTPLWSRLMAGCHPNRDTAATIERAGFAFQRFERFDPFPAWVPARPMLEAVASPSAMPTR